MNCFIRVNSIGQSKNQIEIKYFTVGNIHATTMSLIYNLSITTLVDLGCKITLHGNKVQINEKDVVQDFLFIAAKLALEKNGYIFEIIKDQTVSAVKIELIESSIVSHSDMEEVEIDLNVGDIEEPNPEEPEEPETLPVANKPTRKPRQKRAISNVAIRRIANAGGARRVSKDVYEVARIALESMMDDVMDDANVYKEYFGKKTINADHIKLALENKKNRRF